MQASSSTALMRARRYTGKCLCRKANTEAVGREREQVMEESGAPPAWRERTGGG